MSNSLIPADNTLLLLGVFVAGAYLALLAEQRGPLRGVPAPALIFLAAAVASHTGVLPRAAPFYDLIWEFMVPLAIAMFLIKADLVQIFKRGGRTLVAFALGAAGVVVGAFLGSAVLDLGPEHAKLTGMFSATYIGGSMNFAAVSEAVGFEDRALLSSALAIDNIMGNLCMVLLMALAASRVYQRAFAWRSEMIGVAEPVAVSSAPGAITARDLLATIAVATLVFAAASAIAVSLGQPSYTMLVITVIMTLLATAARRPLARVRGEEAIATVLMYMFIAMVGTGMDVSSLFGSAPGMFLMVLIMFLTHLLFVFGVGYFLKMNYAELVVASLACITGPPIVAALAVAYRWHGLLVPGVLAGILGYVSGNFIGVAIFRLLS